jgi:hypothetical protein
MMQTREKVSEYALSAQYMPTNFINNAFDTEIDFPVVNPEVA